MFEFLDKLIFTTIVAAFAVAVTFLGVAVCLAPTMYRAEKKCLAAGYANYSVLLSAKAYCITRVNGTDIVVPIEEVAE